MSKLLGKIESVHFGFGGYQDAMIGLSLHFSGDGWGAYKFIGTWSIKRSEIAKWTESERVNTLGETVMQIADLLNQAKKKDVSELKGVPVECTFDDKNSLTEWRILKEVI
jgi:hypothetical protein